MTPQDADDFADLDQHGDFYARNPFFSYEATAGLLPFLTSSHARRLLRAPNQIGKTWAICWEAWAHLIGVDRFKQPRAPSSGWFVVADLENTYPVISEKLHDLEPTDWLDPATHYTPGKGYQTNGKNMVRTKLGHTIAFRGGEGSAMSLASGTIGWLAFDEVPKRQHFSEGISRVAVKEAPVFVGLTPINRPTGYLRERVEGNPETGTPPTEEWVQFRPSLTQADCTTESGRVIRSQASIDKQTAGYDAWEFGQRVYGEWEGVTVGRRLGSFTASNVIDLSDVPPLDLDTGDELRVGIDHGEGNGKQMAYLAAVSGRRFWLLGEYIGKGQTTPREDARGILAMLDSVGVHPFAVARWFGDVNSAGRLGGGEKYNAFLEQAIADELGHSQRPVSIETPSKGKGSVSAGESAMNHAMKEGRFSVVNTCGAFQHSARNYTGREADLKDAIDAARYAVADRLIATRTPSGVRLVR